MMKYFFCIFISLSLLFSIVCANVSAVSNAALTECGNAVTLCISLTGIMCFWSGIMRVAQRAGITDLLAKLFSPILRRLFRGLDPKGKSMSIIIMNIVSNLLGLGNAATPFGIAAMKELEKEEKTTDCASNNMIIFVVLNTASIQIIPTTIAALRLQSGSAAPMEILPCVWIVSVIAVFTAVSVAKILGGRHK